MTNKYQFEDIKVSETASGNDSLEGSILCHKGDRVYRLKFNRSKDIPPEAIDKYCAHYFDEFGTDDLNAVFENLNKDGRVDELDKLCTHLFAFSPKNACIEQFFARDNGSLQDVTPESEASDLYEIIGIWYDPTKPVKEIIVEYLDNGEKVSQWYSIKPAMKNKDFLLRTGGEYGEATWRQSFFELQKKDRKAAYKEFERVFGFLPLQGR